MVRAVLFDADGVLVDACELHYVALNRALGTMGWTITRREHETIYNGLPTQRKLELLSERNAFPQDWHKAVHDLKQHYTWEAMDELLSPDLTKRELLSDLRAHGLKVAVCSNSLRRSLMKMLSAIGVCDLVDLALGNDDVKNPKPSPEMYLEAADRLGVVIRECVIVEDSPVGLKAAYSAGPLDVIEVSGPDEVTARLAARIFNAVRQEVA